MVGGLDDTGGRVMVGGLDATGGRVMVGGLDDRSVRCDGWWVG